MAMGNRTHRRGHRKTLFRNEMMLEAYKLGALGLTIPEIADFWNVKPKTLSHWSLTKPEFQAQINKGKAQADLTVVQALLEQCKQGNVTAAIFWLKNRQPEKWKNNEFHFDNSRHLHISNFKDFIENAYNNKNRIEETK